MRRWADAWLSVAALCLAVPVRSQDVKYYAVCDAGSTGTRLYIFELGGASKAKSIFVKKVKPGLSSYADHPYHAVAPLLALFLEGAGKVPGSGDIPMFIFGTAGMRLLASQVQTTLWGALDAGLRDNPSFPFHKDQLTMRTVSGVEEGLWAVVTANFLTDKISEDLQIAKGKPAVGLLDLGGSSTQIAIPPLAKAKGGKVHIGSGATVQSYLGFGMTRLREEIRNKTKSGADAACYMKGYALNESGQQLTGTGSGKKCRELIQKIMQNKSKSCKANRPADKEASCLGDLREKASEHEAVTSGALDFYAVAGFTYAADFVRWWFDLVPNKALRAAGAYAKAFPKPTLKEMAAAADAMCAGAWSVVEAASSNEATKHPFTGPDNTAYRCFQANYIVVLLGKVYGFPETGRGITFALDVDGEDLEWPLGALLHEMDKTRRLTSLPGRAELREAEL